MNLYEIAVQYREDAHRLGDPICEDRFRSEQTCQSVIIPHTPGHPKA